MKTYAKEIKEQVVGRIKNEGISASQAARDAGIPDNTVYGWLRKGIEGGAVDHNILEINRLKRENRDLLELVGKLTMNIEKTKKN
jgi:transposase-like protein